MGSMILKVLQAISDTTKLVTSLLLALAMAGFFFPPITTSLKLLTAWRFGAHGIVKYELGTFNSQSGIANTSVSSRVPTKNGQLYLLSKDQKEFDEIERGDIVRAISTVRVHPDGACVANENCGSSPTIFTLDAKDCAIVFARAYADPKQQSLTGGAAGAPGVTTDVKGGWLRIGTTACGIFN